MRYSQLFTKTKRTLGKGERGGSFLLDKAGYVSQASSGVYNYLPLGLKVLRKMEQIVREEMEAIGASEVLLPSLQTRALWETAGRFQDENLRSILYVDESKEFVMAPTHEELMSQIAKEAIKSYRDLPVLLFQFQAKFRRELRPRSGLLRGREFLMKDLYSFHPTPEAHKEFYEQVAKAYEKSFTRMSLKAVRTKAGGGFFGKEYSDEYQVITPNGEDEILYDSSKNIAFNREIEGDLSAQQKKCLERVRAIEVGNIFHLGTKYSEAFNLKYLDKNGKAQTVVMGSYGIGMSRLLGTVAEVFNDENGLKMPLSVAPFAIYLVDISPKNEGSRLEEELEKASFEVLRDDRAVGAGDKLVEADLIGLPFRVVISPKTLALGQVELKDRSTGKIELVKKSNLVKRLRELIH
jgi:prolyl-tRNA synthetase